MNESRWKASMSHPGSPFQRHFTLRVLDLLTSAELYNSGAVAVSTSFVHLTPDVSSTNGLVLIWDDPGFGKFGLDNITVNTETVPEPGTVGLGLFGLGAIARGRRRFRRD